MIILDASFLIALARPQDEHHAEAAALQKRLVASGEWLYATEIVLSELVAYLCKYNDVDVALAAANRLVESNKTTVVFSALEDCKQALLFLKKFRFNSYSDALSVQVMHSRGIKQIASFDSDFDRVSGITRIH